MESAKECVTTHLPNQLALKMNGAGALGPYLAVAAIVCCNKPRRVRRTQWSALKPSAWARVERPLVQILVVVANIQMRTLKTEVEMGSM